jgi:hypothetical protein
VDQCSRWDGSGRHERFGATIAAFAFGAVGFIEALVGFVSVTRRRAGFVLGLIGIAVMVAAFGSAFMVAVAMNANSSD